MNIKRLTTKQLQMPVPRIRISATLTPKQQAVPPAGRQLPTALITAAL
jgi:hypothetical protein